MPFTLFYRFVCWKQLRNRIPSSWIVISFFFHILRNKKNRIFQSIIIEVDVNFPSIAKKRLRAQLHDDLRIQTKDHRLGSEEVDSIELLHCSSPANRALTSLFFLFFIDSRQTGSRSSPQEDYRSQLPPWYFPFQFCAPAKGHYRVESEIATNKQR